MAFKPPDKPPVTRYGLPPERDRVGASLKGQDACSELDGKPVLIDGRNRREACARVGVAPHYILLNGQDPVAYILSANINRRHMSKGQRAMVVAKVCKETLQGTRKAGIVAQVSHQRIHQANTVLSHAPDLSVQVINGTLSLDKAYEEARIRKGRAETHESRFNALKAASPARGWTHFKQLLRCLA